MKGIVFKQIQHYNSENSINSEFQHANRVGYLTCTALKQSTDDRLKQIDRKLIVGTVLLNISAAFDLLDHLATTHQTICIWIQNFSYQLDEKLIIQQTTVCFL